MNKNRYRVIYSQARGMFIAVAEIVKSRTKNAGGVSKSMLKLNEAIIDIKEG